MEINQNKITRVEVITEKGREFVKWDCKIEMLIQDDERTLKIFTTPEAIKKIKEVKK